MDNRGIDLPPSISLGRNNAMSFHRLLERVLSK
jgi:hypothetical protein